MRSRSLLPLVALNAVVAVYLGLFALWPQPLLLSAAINALVLCVPGLGWLRLVGRLVVDRASAVLLTVALSAGAGALAVVGPILVGVTTGPILHAALVAVLTNAGLAATWGRPWPLAPRPPGTLAWPILAAAGAAAYVALFIGGTRFMPPIPDQDTEIQGTAYGIIHRGVPLMLHDRRLPYHFAHPHLLHWLAAEGMLLSGELEAFKPYYDAAVTARRWRRGPLIPGQAFATYGPPVGWRPQKNPIRVRVLEVGPDAVVLDQPVRVRRADGSLAPTTSPTPAQFWDGVLLRAYDDTLAQTFQRQPLLWQTRLVNFALMLVALFLLHELAGRLSGSLAISILVPLAYASVPEVIGRACCAAYMPVTIVFLVAGGWWYLAPRRGRPGTAAATAPFCQGPWPWGVAFTAGAFLALANHKAVVAVAAMVLAGAVAHALRKGWRGGLRALITSPVLWGFVAGTAAFWVAGLLVSPEVFITDHLLYHGLDRVAHVDTLGYVVGGVYPGVGELWWRFVWDLGLALPAVAAAALVWLVAAGAGRERHVLTLIFWLVLVSVAFSVIDWRQTKHLMHLMPVVVLAPAAAAGWSRRLGRVVWTGLLVVALLAAATHSVDWISRGFYSWAPAGEDWRIR